MNEPLFNQVKINNVKLSKVQRNRMVLNRHNVLRRTDRAVAFNLFFETVRGCIKKGKSILCPKAALQAMRPWQQGTNCNMTCEVACRS